MLRLVRNIKFNSTDKDNMEYNAYASCYQVDALRQLLEEYEGLKEKAWMYDSLNK